MKLTFEGNKLKNWENECMEFYHKEIKSEFDFINDFYGEIYEIYTIHGIIEIKYPDLVLSVDTATNGSLEIYRESDFRFVIYREDPDDDLIIDIPKQNIVYIQTKTIRKCSSSYIEYIKSTY